MANDDTLTLPPYCAIDEEKNRHDENGMGGRNTNYLAVIGGAINKHLGVLLMSGFILGGGWTLHGYLDTRFDDLAGKLTSLEKGQAALSYRVGRLEDENRGVRQDIGRLRSDVACLQADTREMWGLFDRLYTPGYKPNRYDYTSARQRAKDACDAARFSAAYRIGDGGTLDLLASGPRDKVLDDAGSGKLQFEFAKTKNNGSPGSLQDALERYTAERKLSSDESAQLRTQVEGVYSSLRENESLIILGDHYNK